MTKHTLKISWCDVNTARFLKYIWPFCNIMHVRVHYLENYLEEWQTLTLNSQPHKKVKHSNNSMTIFRRIVWVYLTLFGCLALKVLIWALPWWYSEENSKLKNLYGPFLWMGFHGLKATESLRVGSLLFTTKFSEIALTHLIDHGRMKGWVDLGATRWF